MKRFLLVGTVILIIISTLYLAFTFVPILIVESKYQLQKNLLHLTGKKSLLELIVPEIEFSRVAKKERDFAIEMPSVFVHEPVIFNTNPIDKEEYTAALRKGIAHAAGTATPGSGKLGYYFAHSSSPELRTQFNAVFYILNKLQREDSIYIWYNNEKYTYVVKKKEITEPSYTTFLEDNYPNETIVLQTCWPPGTTAKRLLVFAEKQ